MAPDFLKISLSEGHAGLLLFAMGLPLRNNDFAAFIIFMVAQSRKVPTLGCYV